MWLLHRYDSSLYYQFIIKIFNKHYNKSNRARAPSAGAMYKVQILSQSTVRKILSNTHWSLSYYANRLNLNGIFSDIKIKT